MLTDKPKVPKTPKTPKTPKNTVTVVMDNPITEGPPAALTLLCGRLINDFQHRGLPGVLERLEEATDEMLLEAAAERLKEGFNRTDLADQVLGRLKKIRLDLGAASGPVMEIIGSSQKCLSVKLTTEEIAKASHSSLELYRQIEELEAEAKAEAKARKEVIDSLKASASLERKKALDGTEDRQVEVIIQWDPSAQSVVEVRSDTGEVVCHRAPTKEEKQRPLPGFGGGS